MTAPRVLSISGFERSGSTLLADALGQVPRFVSVGELKFIWSLGVIGNRPCGCGRPFHECPFWQRVGEEAFGGWDHVDAEAVSRLRRRVDRATMIPFLVAPRAYPPFRRRFEQYALIMERLYAAICRAAGASVVVDSTKHLGTALFLRTAPRIDTSFLHLVRDSRGVAFSLSKQVAQGELKGQTLYMPRFGAGSAAMRWLGRNVACHVMALGRRRAFVRYESFVAEPRQELERVLGELGFDVDERALAFVAGGEIRIEPSHTVHGNPGRFARGSMTLRVDDAWRRQMPTRARATVTALTWPLLVRYGYGRRPPT